MDPVIIAINLANPPVAMGLWLVTVLATYLVTSRLVRRGK